jgi:bifunctional UDP-N-acetylglucosamine pyrophosphorylase/glucosamine-1-phosphate N-acetyltransferase
MQAVVLAAGMGTRLRPVTANRSKAMVPVLGRPLVERALLPFVENGVRDFVFVISPDDTDIRRHFSERTELDITARFVIQEERLGTAHALGTAAPLLSGRFAVSACDSLVDGSHVRALLAEGDGPDAVLSLLDVEPDLVSRSAAVSLDGHTVRRIVEKPTREDAPSFTVSLPHYIFSPRLLDLLPRLDASPRGEYEIPDAIQGLIDAGRQVAGVRAEKRLQVSSPEDLLSLTRQMFLDHSESMQVDPARDDHGTTFVEPLLVEREVVLGDGCEVGPDVFLESGCHIGRGAVVRRSIVLRGGRVDDGQTIEDQVVV